jgi:hypothetical protein
MRDNCALADGKWDDEKPRIWLGKNGGFTLMLVNNDL